ncbi:transcriptional regulator [Roseomonas sp. SSH11]|uniref:Transcriptional regulator n=1 Tax=Pararoseomonas baculiformis TaxID=2820812 RepID=A0ABS4AAG7_9PROT|nr:transcriptional regulator [Pararoseomonas baculiformis]MBP0443982.1 transcriptional regulator [Pararoseomonas baculiformis]
MIIFLDFEASSLGKRGFPVEVGWVGEDGHEEEHLIRPAPDWDEWDAEAERIHGLTRQRLEREGRPHDAVARRMVEVLTPHSLYASAPSWDGQWLSRLLRAAGLPRHALRLKDTEEARRDAALAALLSEGIDPARQSDLLDAVLRQVAEEAREASPDHRALADAKREMALWRGMADRVRKALGEAR